MHFTSSGLIGTFYTSYASASYADTLVLFSMDIAGNVIQSQKIDWGASIAQETYFFRPIDDGSYVYLFGYTENYENNFV